jgi:orotate phosphoribosyltransferase
VTNGARDRLLDLLARHAYAFDADRGFQLSSGERSSEYIDCKSALSFPEGIGAASALLLPLVKPEVIAVGGLTMGADPIAISLSLYAHAHGRSLRWFTVRKGPKQHGLQRQIEGGLPAHSRLAILDDVVTKGTSTIEAIEKCRSAGHVVVQALALVDREQGGLQSVQGVLGADVPVQAVFTKSEIHRAWQALHAAPGSSATT